MCDIECRKRFLRMEIEIATIGNDIRWLKKIGGGLLLLLAAFLGIDVSGLV